MAVIYRAEDRIHQSSNTGTAGGTIYLSGLAPAGAFNFRDYFANGAIVPLELVDNASGVFEFSYGTLAYGAGDASTDSIHTRTITRSSSGIATPEPWGAGIRNAYCMVTGRDILSAPNALGELTAPQVTTARSNLGLGTAALLSASSIVQFPSGGVVKLTFNCAPPTGWTRINVTGERMARYATVADSPEAQGGSWTISGLTTAVGTTGGHGLALSEIPPHYHNGTVIFVQSGSSFPVVNTVDKTLFGTGGEIGDVHSHSVPSAAVASSGLWRPAYEIVVKASFN